MKELLNTIMEISIKDIRILVKIEDIQKMILKKGGFDQNYKKKFNKKRKQYER